MKQQEDVRTPELPGLDGFAPPKQRPPEPQARSLPPGVPGANFRERERVKRKSLRWVARLANTPANERAYIRSALDTLELTAANIATTSDATDKEVAVLFARADSVYKTLSGCDVYDIDRDARTWPGGAPVVAHPPCRAWGSLSYFAKPAPGEKGLAIWAVEQVRLHGGVLEHPKRSKLWAAAGLPLPGQGHDEWGGWTIEIAQYWFGHRAEKKTFLYIVGCDEPPPLPLKAGRATHVIASGIRNHDGTRPKKGDQLWRPEVSDAEREHTPAQFARWLVELARRCKVTNAQR